MVDVRWILKAEGMRYDVYSPAKEIKVHILLPKGKACSSVMADGVPVSFEKVRVAQSDYVDFEITDLSGKVSIEILF